MYLFLFFNEGVTVVLILSILNFMEVLIDIFHLVLNVNLIKINPKTQGHLGGCGNVQKVFNQNNMTIVSIPILIFPKISPSTNLIS